MDYPNRILEPKLIITIIIIMTTVAYLNQEVPACINNPIEKSATVQTNYSFSDVDNLNNKSQSNIMVFETSGNSMFPIIKDKQKCVCMKSDSYVVGDIVVFFANLGDGFTGIAHRIINIEGENITTKGVNNNESDYPIKKENLLCKIPMIKRYQLLKNG